ncbi:hypothetical protein KOY_04867 [Bacillus cereus VDM021]|nr:hypothetical protein KOY_04867 [Bacillus cereus VDM021]
MGLRDDELEKVQRAMSLNPGYKTSTGYTGNAKKKDKEKPKATAKQRRIDHLTRKQKRELWHIQSEFNKMWERNSNISRKEEGKITKKDVKDGVSAEGVWSKNQYTKYQSMINTFLKHCYEEYGVTKLRDVKPKMIGSFFQTQLDKENSAKTMDLYMSSIKKMCEMGEKEGLEHFGGLVNSKHLEMLPSYSQDDYRRGHKGGYTVHDVQKMSSAAGKHFSEYHRVAIEILGYSGPRLDEFRRIKWSSIDFENNRIMLTDSNMTKGARPRFVPVREKTMGKLKEIYDLGLHKNDNQRIWGSRMSEKDVRGFVKECAKLGGAKYSGIHDFRKSTVDYQITKMEREIKRGKLDKTEMVNRVMQHVGADSRLNPIVEKTELKRNKKGEVVYKKRKNGTKYPVCVSVLDGDGNPVMGPKYSTEDLMGRRMDFIKNLYLSQILGHNRTDITAVYKKKKE